MVRGESGVARGQGGSSETPVGMGVAKARRAANGVRINGGA